MATLPDYSVRIIARACYTRAIVLGEGDIIEIAKSYSLSEENYNRVVTEIYVQHPELKPTN